MNIQRETSVCPVTDRSLFGGDKTEKAFAMIASCLWNFLPVDVCQEESLQTFRKGLKTIISNSQASPEHNFNNNAFLQVPLPRYLLGVKLSTRKCLVILRTKQPQQ